MMAVAQMPTEPVNNRSHLSGDTTVNREELRARLRQMTDNELRRFGRAAQNMYSPEANRGKLPRQEFVIQLEEARRIRSQLLLASTSAPGWPFNKPECVDTFLAEMLSSSDRPIDDGSDIT
jgi:hypothetical protein